MIYINLLPWREYKLAYKKKLSEYFLISGAVAIISVFLIAHFWLKQTNHYLANQLIQMESTLNDYKQFKEKHFMIKEDNAQHSVASLAFAKQIFSPSQSEQQVCFKEIVYTGNIIHFSGLTKSAQTLTEFLLNWKYAQGFIQMQIESMKQVQNLVEFRFHGEIKK